MHARLRDTSKSLLRYKLPILASLSDDVVYDVMHNQPSVSGLDALTVLMCTVAIKSGAELAAASSSFV